MESKAALILVISLVISFLSLNNIVLSAEAINNLTVTVSVQQMAIVDVTPKLLSYQGYPGKLASATDNSVNKDPTTQSYYITVTNLGSVRILNLRARVDLPTQDPWGYNNPALHTSGDFILISNTTAGSNFAYVTQRLFNKTPPMYIIPPTGCPQPQYWDPNVCQFYILRTVNETSNEGEDWFIIVKKGALNYTNGTVYFASVPRTQSISGTTDFSSLTGYTLTSNGNYGYVDVSSILNRYYLKGVFIVNTTGSEAYFTYWGVDVARLAGAPENYLCPGDLSNPCLLPAQSKDFRVQVRIPYGVPAGSIVGKLYIIATSE
ncbi:MAG: hypothetical protein QW197_01305 [Candidatus Aenigmatarchaeota archaeon]